MTHRVLTVSSAYHATGPEVAGAIVVHGSYLGVLPARLIAGSRPHAVLGVDCEGLAGSGSSGVWYLEALGIAALTAHVDSVRLLDGSDVLRNGRVKELNRLAWEAGVRPEESVRVAVTRLASMNEWPAEVDLPRSRRTVAAASRLGRRIVCLDSIADALPEDSEHVLCVGGFAGAANMLRAQPWGVICSDGGRGRDAQGVSGLAVVDAHRIPAAAVLSVSARIGDGYSTYMDGEIGAVNGSGRQLGVVRGMDARHAAELFAARAD